MYETYEHMEFTRPSDGVLLVSFNHPDSLNAITGQCHTELSRVFAEIALDTEARAVVLTGQGRAFSAGGDFDWILGQSSKELDMSFAEARKMVLDILDLPQPLIAAVNGHAAGFGTTLALLCDFSYVAETARLSDPHITLGMVPGDGAMLIWPLLVGMARAKRYLLTGDPIGGPTAAEIGLVTESLLAEDVLPRALAMASRLASMHSLAVQGTRRTLNALLHQAGSSTLDLGLAKQRLTQNSQEHRKIVQAVKEGHEARRKSKAQS